MPFNIFKSCKPSCIHSDEGTQIKIKSSCFDHTIILNIDDNDIENLNTLEDFVNKIKVKKHNSINKHNKNNNLEGYNYICNECNKLKLDCDCV